MPNSKNTALAMTLGLALALGACGEGAGRGDAAATSAPVAAHPWMSASIIAEQADAATDADKEAVANRRAHLLLGAMTLEQKMQQLTGARPEIVPELPQCFGGRHVSGIAALKLQAGVPPDKVDDEIYATVDPSTPDTPFLGAGIANAGN